MRDGIALSYHSILECRHRFTLYDISQLADEDNPPDWEWIEQISREQDHDPCLEIPYLVGTLDCTGGAGFAEGLGFEPSESDFWEDGYEDDRFPDAQVEDRLRATPGSMTSVQSLTPFEAISALRACGLLNADSMRGYVIDFVESHDAQASLTSILCSYIDVNVLHASFSTFLAEATKCGPSSFG